jgi:hypothetical protein
MPTTAQLSGIGICAQTAAFCGIRASFTNIL